MPVLIFLAFVVSFISFFITFFITFSATDGDRRSVVMHGIASLGFSGSLAGGVLTYPGWHHALTTLLRVDMGVVALALLVVNVDKDGSTSLAATGSKAINLLVAAALFGCLMHG